MLRSAAAVLLILLLALGGCAEEPGLPKNLVDDELATKLLGTDPAMRRRAIDSLATMGAAGTTILIAALEHDSTRNEAAEALVGIQPVGEESLSDLIRQATDGDMHTQDLAVHVLKSLGMKGTSALLEVAFTSEGLGSTRALMALMQADKFESAAVQKLITYIKEGGEDERGSAVLILGRAGSDAVPCLVDLLRDDDLAVTASAGLALTRIGAGAVTGLSEAIFDSTTWPWSIQILGWIGPSARGAWSELVHLSKVCADVDSLNYLVQKAMMKIGVPTDIARVLGVDWLPDFPREIALWTHLYYLSPFAQPGSALDYSMEREILWNDSFVIHPKAMGVVIARGGSVVPEPLTGSGTVLVVYILAGRAGNINYAWDGGWAEAGEYQTFYSYGGDNIVAGAPEVGSIVMWHGDESGYAYGWHSVLEPATRASVVNELCGIVPASERAEALRESRRITDWMWNEWQLMTELGSPIHTVVCDSNWSAESNQQFTSVDADTCSERLSMVRIPAGKFTMGSPVTELGHRDDEKEHEVVISKAFLMSSFEITEAIWDAVLGSGASTSQLPKVDISWDDAVEFCNALSVRESLTPAYEIRGTHGDVRWIREADGYRLPTEAEWEYACRSGTVSAFSSGRIGMLGFGADANLDEMGWYWGNSGGNRKRVGTKKANSWGLYDMHGNVNEWCLDVYATDYENLPPKDPVYAVGKDWPRVVRGGCSGSVVEGCRSAIRGACFPHTAGSIGGFRIVRSAD